MTRRFIVRPLAEADLEDAVRDSDDMARCRPFGVGGRGYARECVGYSIARELGVDIGEFTKDVDYTIESSCDGNLRRVPSMRRLAV